MCLVKLMRAEQIMSYIVIGTQNVRPGTEVMIKSKVQVSTYTTCTVDKTIKCLGEKQSNVFHYL